MGFIQEILSNAQATYSLQRRYYWLTTTVGLLAVVVGIPAMLLVANLLAAWLGVPLNSRAQETPGSVVWALFFLMSIPLVLYASVVVVAWLATFPMCWFGAMAPQDVKYYVLRSRYPAHWFKR